MEKLPPHNIDAEEAVLGSILIDGYSIEKVADFLRPDDFYSERGHEIYGASLSLYQRDATINQITVAEELNSRGRLETVGGGAYLSFLVANVPTSLDIEEFAGIVHRLSLARNLISAGSVIAAIGYEPNINIDDAIDRSRAILDAVKPARSRRLQVQNLRIIKSNPRHYILDVNSVDMRLSRTELLNKGKFKAKVVDERDFIPILPRDWDSFVSKLLSGAREMEAPLDASPEIEVIQSMKRCFDQKGEGEEYSDIQSGCYIIAQYRGPETDFEPREYWAFQPMPLLKWLRRDLAKAVTRDTLWATILPWGAVRHQWRIGKERNMPIKMWALPSDFADKIEFEVEKQERLDEGEGEEELPDI